MVRRMMACYVIQHSSNLGVGHSTVNPTTNSGIDTKWMSQANLVEKLTPSSGVSDQRKSDPSHNPICEIIILMWKWTIHFVQFVQIKCHKLFLHGISWIPSDPCWKTQSGPKLLPTQTRLNQKARVTDSLELVCTLGYSQLFRWPASLSCKLDEKPGASPSWVYIIQTGKKVSFYSSQTRSPSLTKLFTKPSL